MDIIDINKCWYEGLLFFPLVYQGLTKSYKYRIWIFTYDPNINEIYMYASHPGVEACRTNKEKSSSISINVKVPKNGDLLFFIHRQRDYSINTKQCISWNFKTLEGGLDPYSKYNFPFPLVNLTLWL